MKRTPMKRTPMKRGTTPVQRANPGRRIREFARVYGSAERVAFVQALPSVVSGEGPCENAHVQGGGAGRKADARWIVPLTPGEHAALHQVGRATFEATHRIDLHAAAQRIERQWQQHRIAQHSHSED